MIHNYFHYIYSDRALAALVMTYVEIKPYTIMFKIIFVIICLGLFGTGRADNELAGKGMWSLISVGECPDSGLSRETIECEVNKHKLNRSHDGITAHLKIREEINEAFGIYIDVCKFVDGGCKLYQIISDNMGKLCDKYAKPNVIKALQMGNFKSDYFPIEEGEYDLEDYMLDYCDLPSDCPYGKYEAIVYLLSNQQRIFCVKVVVECKKCEEDEECCEDPEEK